MHVCAGEIMKLNTTFATIIVTFVMLTVPFSIMGDSNATNITNGLSSEDLESSNTDIQIAILSDNAKSIIAPLSFGTSKINAISTLNQVTNQSVVIIDSDWSNSNSSLTTYERIADLISTGIVVTSVGSADLFLDNPYLPFVSYSEGADTISIYCDGAGRYISHCVKGSNTDQAIAKTYCWIDSQLSFSSISNAVRTDSYNLPWGEEYMSSGDYYHDGFGWMNVRTAYFCLSEENLRYNYYYAHHLLQSVPDSGKATADMTVSCQNNQNNLTYLNYGPTSTSGTTTVGVSFGSEISAGGPSSSYQVSWSYSVGDVTVNDQSNLATGLIKIWHNVDEKKSVGQNTYKVEPGKLIRVDCQEGPGYCIQRDVYSIQFFKDNLIFDEFSTIEKTQFVIFKGLPHTITYDCNGADGHIYEDEDPGLFVETWDETYSEGTYVTLYDMDYYKNGFTFAGYSTNPNATSAEYDINDQICIDSDLTLYMVWVPNE